jgi:hypothetical protein
MLSELVNKFSLTQDQTDTAVKYLAAQSVTLRQIIEHLDETDQTTRPVSVEGYAAYANGKYTPRIDVLNGTHHCSCRSTKNNALPYPCTHAIALVMAVDNGQQIDLTQPAPRTHSAGAASSVASVTQATGQPRRARGEAFRAKISESIGSAIHKVALTIHDIIKSGELPYMRGPTGCGKTTAVNILATKILNCRLLHHTGAHTWADADLIGLRMPGGIVIDGPIARAFSFARNGEKTIIFLDEFTRNNERIVQLLMTAVQSKSAEEMLARGIDTNGQSAFLVEAPVYGEIWAPSENIIWILGANPWGTKTDPAWGRRVFPVDITYDLDVLKHFDSGFAERVKLIWELNTSETLSLPIEYQQLSKAHDDNDEAVFKNYLKRLKLVDKEQYDHAVMVLGVS